MGVRGSGEAAAKALRQRIRTHPIAEPRAPGTSGVWQVRRVRSAPLGCVLSRPEFGRVAYRCYSHGRDDAGGQPWLRQVDSLNSAVAWMIQHEEESSTLTSRLRPEPDELPS